MTRTLRRLPGPTSIAIALALSACHRARLPGAGVPSPAPPAGASSVCEPGRYVDAVFPDVKVKKNVVYSRFKDGVGSRVLKMDVYSPKKDPEPRRPAIVWLFGGNFITGDRRQLAFFAKGFASRGYVAAAVDYRLLHKPGVPNPQAAQAAQSDAQAAIRFLRSRAADLALDPERIVVAGFSAGSITAFNVGYRSAFVGDDTAHAEFPHTVEGVVGLDGFAGYDGMQPNDPPFVLFRSGAAARGESPELAMLTASADAAGIPYDVQLVRGTRHVDLIQPPHNRWILARAAEFLREHVACR